MKIIVDAMGGDNAPRETVLGAVKACEETGIKIILIGRSQEIEPLLNEKNSKNIEVVDAQEVITNEESPVTAIRRKKESSIVKGLGLLKEKKADAMVSAGSTGALMAGGLFILGRFEGVDRPAIAVVIPSKKDPVLLLDIGANSEVKPNNLVQFALMGSIYAREVLKRKDPRVGLLNIGVEEEKGSSVIKSAYSSLKMIKDINFAGNIEARDFFNQNADVVICDGFTGNIFLKTVEGFGMFIFDRLKQEIKKNITYSLGALLLMPAMKAVKSSLDYSEYGGAMFLGLNGVLIKCHGSSDRKAIYNGIKAAKRYAEANINNKLKKSLEINTEGKI
ncbi:phosphate acyltransferase PlsX [Biomaibacter acetigenes]|jgi:glycerol-3-phosphate acyltransferase PlsX|uniref:Phosphate acyltransferase n=1 Tax=Biomaibacter acetigenes TaxID=2316383 RepID=A0A3G2R4Q3_9FIRM|nr:phosphate acyltransferase PlsX [Biomaibacter acetigenes]AYO30426.1 phosphate acyltransferase PlsX [Biomaibacter acetigenes]MDN5300597.1 phosphate acyltransferase [Thermoanaerobacteraceae bacterium]MDN5312492.1 phosphate acyltransferase [Thermoanaerobacteraceae bacterium]RKL62877.1 phosphate acyltransferase PlsX [Thermoanaerobacteraceae bacterium SP2]